MINNLRLLGEDKSSWLYWVYLLLMYIRRYHLFGLPYFLIMVIYAYCLSFRLVGFTLLPKVCFSSGVFRVRLRIKRNGIFNIKKGLLILERWRSGVASTISIAENAVMEVADTFILGDNCKISLSPGSKLLIGGASKGQVSGITSDTVILCERLIEIGGGTVISWGCYISDSSQHEINGVVKIVPVSIGEHVWISEGVTCAPGTIMSEGSIAGAKSYLNDFYPKRSFVAGCPAKVKRNDVSWKR